MESYIKYLKLTFLTIFLFIFNYASFAAPAGTIRDSFEIVRWKPANMTITENNDIYIYDYRNGTLKADLESKIWKSVNDEISFSEINTQTYPIEKKTNTLQFQDSLYGNIIYEYTKGNDSWLLTNLGYLCKLSGKIITAYKMRAERPIQLNAKEKDTLYNSMTYYNGIYYYARYKSIYCKDGNSGNWYRYLDSNKETQYVWKDHNGVYMCDENFNKYQINQEIDSIKPYVENLADLKNKQINKVIIERGTIGCEDGHTDGFKIIYRLKNKHFFVDEKTIYGEGSILKKMPRKITKSSIENLLQYSYKAMCGIIDTIPFELTDKDFKKIKDEIDCKLASVKETQNELFLLSDDFSFINEDEDYDYRITVNDMRNLSTKLDTLKITKDILNTILTDLYLNYFSTERRYRIVKLIMNDGSWLKFENEAYIPNYLCCPWTILYNGNPFIVKSLAVGKSIDDMTNGKFMPECNTKEYAIGKILKHYLYNQEQ